MEKSDDALAPDVRLAALGALAAAGTSLARRLRTGRRLPSKPKTVGIGNLRVGGTGKTPVTVWLANSLAGRGFSPGVVSRGYGGSRSGTSMRVDARSDPAVVGDEPVLIARASAGARISTSSEAARAFCVSTPSDGGVSMTFQ